MLLRQWSFFQNSNSTFQDLASATCTIVFSSEIPKHKETSSKNSILVAAVGLHPGPFKFAWGEGLKKISPSNTSKSGKLTEN